MPAAVNTSAVGGSITAVATTASVTPGGVDRAVLLAAMGALDSANYPSSAHWTISAVDTAIDQVLGADTPIDIFDFFFAYTKTFSEAGSPAVLSTFKATFPTAPFAGVVAAICVEGADQTTPFGTEQISAEQVVENDPQVFVDTYEGLLPGQLVIGFLYVLTVGDSGPVGYTAGGDIDTLLPVTPNTTTENRHPKIVPFWGVADGTGTFVASISVDMPSVGELATGLIKMRPVNDAAGGGDTPIDAGHGAFTLTGQSAALRYGRRMAANQAAVALTARAAALRRTRIMAGLHGAFALTAQDVALRRGLRVVAGFGSFLLAGQAAAVRVGRRVNIGQGAFSFTGQSVDLRYGASLAIVADAAAFTASGQTVRLLYPKRVTVDSASFALTVRDVTLSKARVMSVDASTFAFTAHNVGLLCTRRMTALSAAFLADGQNATLIPRSSYVRSVDRTLLIEPEDRALVVESEDRTILIDAENRAVTT